MEVLQAVSTEEVRRELLNRYKGEIAENEQQISRLQQRNQQLRGELRDLGGRPPAASNGHTSLKSRQPHRAQRGQIPELIQRFFETTGQEEATIEEIADFIARTGEYNPPEGRSIREMMSNAVPAQARSSRGVVIRVSKGKYRLRKRGRARYNKPQQKSQTATNPGSFQRRPKGQLTNLFRRFFEETGKKEATVREIADFVESTGYTPPGGRTVMDYVSQALPGAHARGSVVERVASATYRLRQK